MPDGRLGVLAVLREDQPQPLHLLEEVCKARGSIQAAAAVWRSVRQGLQGGAAVALVGLCMKPCNSC